MTKNENQELMQQKRSFALWPSFGLRRLPFKNAQSVAFDPKDDSVIYVSTFGASVWKGHAEP